MELWQITCGTIAVSDERQALIALCEEQESTIEDLRYSLSEAEKERDDAEYERDDMEGQLEKAEKELDELQEKIKEAKALLNECLYDPEQHDVLKETIQSLKELLT